MQELENGPNEQAPAANSRAAQLARFRWKPGQSGNPSGRPRSPDAVLAKARALAKDASVEALATMLALMRSASDQKLRFLAAKQVYEIAAEMGTAKDPAGLVRSREVPASAAELEALFERVGREALVELARSTLPDREHEVGVEQGSKVPEPEPHTLDDQPSSPQPGTYPPPGGTLTGTPRPDAGERSGPEEEA